MGKSFDLALVIGNSRLHWAVLSHDGVLYHWDTDYLDDQAIALLLPPPSTLHPLPSTDSSTLHPLPSTDSSTLHRLLTLAPPDIPHPTPLAPTLLLASVVPHQTQRWQHHVETEPINLNHIPLQGLYPTLGIDRALAVLGAGERYGFPVLVIDGGTALTFTGVDGDRRLVGGAILPGLQVQGRSLTAQTAALPAIQFTPDTAVPRWATNTVDAIQSGILYTLLAGISDFVRHWRHRHPGSPVIFTGGDGQMLLTRAQNQHPHLAIGVAFDATIVFEGMRVVKLSRSVQPLENPWA